MKPTKGRVPLVTIISPDTSLLTIFDDIHEAYLRYVDLLHGDPWGLGNESLVPHKEGWCINSYFTHGNGKQKKEHYLKHKQSQLEGVNWIDSFDWSEDRERRKTWVEFVRVRAQPGSIYEAALRVDGLNDILIMAQSVR